MYFGHVTETNSASAKDRIQDLTNIGSKFTATKPPKPTPRPRQKAGKRDSSVL
jgi:hypothetical protein